MEPTKNNAYTNFLHDVQTFIPQERIYTDELRRLAWGTDAGFYRLIPQVVIRSKDEDEVSQLLRLATRHGVPVTFRAAGTSLSGQAISDSVLIVAGKHWEQYSISPDHEQITLQPGLIGQRVNELLAPYGRKFAPDPASVKSAMVGGIVMNNASGMNCGTHRPGRRHRAGHGRPRQPRLVRGDPPRIPATPLRPARPHPRRRGTGRTHPL